MLANIRANLLNLAVQIPERLQTFESEAQQPLTFANFVRYHDYEPEVLLKSESWSGWKARSGLQPAPTDPDHDQLRASLIRMASVNGPRELARLRGVTNQLLTGDVDGALVAAETFEVATHYRFWGRGGRQRQFPTVRDSLARIAQNPALLAPFTLSTVRPELVEGLNTDICMWLQSLPDDHRAPLRLPARVGFFFSPSTMYADFPISRELFHWESQSNTSQASPTGQNIIQHQQRGYTILLFARDVKQRNDATVPFTYLGPADVERYESERPIKVVYRLRHPMPAEMFKTNRRGG